MQSLSERIKQFNNLSNDILPIVQYFILKKAVQQGVIQYLTLLNSSEEPLHKDDFIKAVVDFLLKIPHNHLRVLKSVNKPYTILKGCTKYV